MIEVLDPGPLTTVQDRGRPGLAHLGVSPSGAADPRAYELGNALAGNRPGAASLESTLAGPRLRFLADAVVALTGAVHRPPFEVAAGEVLEVGGYVHGARTYVAVRGGIAVEPVLGSRSTDLMGGLGPPVARAGDVLPVGGEAGEAAAVEPDPLPGEPVLRVVPGPRAEWFAPGALEALTSQPWRISAASNRIGIRLDGEPLAWARREELRSEGLVTGSLQVPPNGLPILLGPDHPTTGGYPVIAVVRSEDLWLAGQLRPGGSVTFERVAPSPRCQAPCSTETAPKQD
ncbi:MAG TPA: biotin-dependent carboxyltransferase family protein [Gaiellaceae bacterium]